MSISYAPSTNFTAKDSLSTSNPDKVLSGVPFDAEFNAISNAFAQAASSASPTFSGTATFDDITFTTGTAITSLTFGSTLVNEAKVQGWDTIDTIVSAGATSWDATTQTVNTKKANWDEAYSWGNHALAGYTTTDTTYSAGAGIAQAGTVFSHADTSSAASVNNSGNTFIQDLTFDAYGHVTGYTSGTATSSDTTYSAGAGISQTGTVFSHADTSTASSVNNSGNTFIQDLTFDEYGHVTGYTSGTATSSGVTGGTNINVSGSTVNLDSSISGLTDVTTSAVSIGSWEIKLDGSDLRFVYGGVDKFRITTAGQLIASGDVTAFGAP